MSQELVNAIVPIFVAVLFSFVAGGATVTALIAVVFRMVLKSPVILSFLEKIYMGLAPEWKEALKDAVQLGEEVTDDIPAGQKPAIA
jgi:hypothetical protein